MAIKDLLKKWGLALVMALLFAVTFGSYLSITAYKSGLSSTYTQLTKEWLVVQENNGIGEIHGSRLDPEIGQLLVRHGYTHAVPEIHQIVGTTLANGMLMRGVSLEDYQSVTAFSMVAGTALEPDSASKLAMVGRTLAEIEKIKVGDKIRVRGRDFSVIGIFSTGTYQDNEVWISLKDAQNLINYGEDVSIYFIPDGGSLQEGDSFAEGVSIGRKGEMGRTYGREVASFYNYMGMVAIFAGVATIITLTNLLWRLAWLHRREFGIIRTLGFGRRWLIFYLFVQAAIILVIGLTLGWILAKTLIIAETNKLTAFGIGVIPAWNLRTFLTAAGVFSLVLFIGIAYPAIRINRMSIPDLLGRE